MDPGCRLMASSPRRGGAARDGPPARRVVPFDRSKFTAEGPSRQAEGLFLSVLENNSAASIGDAQRISIGSSVILPRTRTIGKNISKGATPSRLASPSFTCTASTASSSNVASTATQR